MIVCLVVITVPFRSNWLVLFQVFKTKKAKNRMKNQKWKLSQNRLVKRNRLNVQSQKLSNPQSNLIKRSQRKNVRNQLSKRKQTSPKNSFDYPKI